MTTPYEQGDDLDFIVLGITPSPGMVTLSGHDRWKNWDVQKAKGTTGASTTLNGDDPGQFTATFYLADDGTEKDAELNDFDRWEDFQRLIESTTSGPTPKALPIYHPDLARNGFTEVVSAGVGAPTYDKLGGRTHVVKFLEYKPAKPKPAKKAAGAPAGASSGTPGKPSKPDPNAAAKAQLAALLAEAKKP